MKPTHSGRLYSFVFSSISYLSLNGAYVPFMMIVLLGSLSNVAIAHRSRYIQVSPFRVLYLVSKEKVKELTSSMIKKSLTLSITEGV